MNKYEFIKKTVEKYSCIEDISIRNRKRFISDVRFCYFALCKKYLKIKYSDDIAACLIDRDRCTSIQSLKQFEINYRQPSFTASIVYESCEMYLSKCFNSEKDVDYDYTLKIELMDYKISYYNTKIEEIKQERDRLITEKIKRIEVKV